ncbi:MAG: Na+/H+ antiporter subunit B [Chloroflexi bacterium]|nr:Na+/H+ antiporter subunit B [Chloroflexota bacterium]
MKPAEKDNTIPSLILLTATRYLVPVLLLFSLFLLTRGHNEPGGGFVGGLVAGAAFALYGIAHTVHDARRLLRFPPRVLIGIGLLVAVGSGLFSLFYRRPFMTGIWSVVEVPVIGKVGTPGIFDIGVFITVLGMVLQIVFELMEE